MIAVDASVACKWLWPEAGQEEADGLLRGQRRLLAPELIRLEVAGAVLRRVREGNLPEAEGRQRYRRWRQLLAEGAVFLVPDEEVLDEAVECSFQLRHAIQDCLYLAAARRFGVRLVTADRTFHDRARAAGADVRMLPGCQAS